MKRNKIISQNKINKIVNKIAKEFRPEKIILFGSYANGKPDKNSDIDLCIIMKNVSSPYQIAYKIEKLLDDFMVPTDIVVYSQHEIEEWKNVKMAFPTIIMKTGKIVYEKK